MLARQHKVTRGVDYRRISRAKRVGGRNLVVHGTLQDDATTPTRFGFIVTKRVGVAVIRNRMRRRLKAICLELLQNLEPGQEFIIRLQPPAAQLSYADLREQVRRQTLALSEKLQPRASETCSCGDEPNDN